MVLPTITAIATPSGNGGIGIIRISGPDSRNIGLTIFKHGHASTTLDDTSSISSCEIISHHLYYGHIVNPSSGQIIDEVLFVFMKAPYTYTREDIVEIHAHSGHYTLKAILEILINLGVEPAEPGEFTRRAFLNGRIDLTQSEAIIDIINARSSLALKAATNQIFGGLRQKINTIRDSLLSILSLFEATIDFPDEVDDIIDDDKILKQIHLQVLEPINNMLGSYEEKNFIRNGMKVVIVGAPNVGKSSLLNQLVHKQSAIVTPIPGTTRDLIEEHINLEGIQTLLIDTAGIHETSNPIEVIGIQRAKEQIDSADLVLFMIQAGAPFSDNEISIYHSIQNKDVLLVVNKSDLVGAGYKAEIPSFMTHLPTCLISALYNNGIDHLKHYIIEKLLHRLGDDNDLLLPNLRHKKALEKCRDAILAFERRFKEIVPYDFLVIDIKEGIDWLSEITGETIKTDTLDRIFESFCIGK